MTQESAAPAWRDYWPRRFTLVGLCFAGTFICYIDRVNISVAVIPMASEFGWDRTLQGVILSSFFYGYLATQIAGGWLADRYGGKLVLGAGVLLWSLFTVLTPPAATAGFAVLFLTRVAMGMGEGVTFPSIYSLFARWVPQQEVTRAIGLNSSGIPLGTVTSPVTTTSPLQVSSAVSTPEVVGRWLSIVTLTPGPGTSTWSSKSITRERRL